MLIIACNAKENQRKRMKMNPACNAFDYETNMRAIKHVRSASTTPPCY
jgi:hypothetical protein